MKKLHWAITTALVAVLATHTAGTMQAQTGSRSKGKPAMQSGSGTRNAKPAHYNALWGWLKSTDYTKWNGGDGKQVDFQEGNSPHGARIKTYVNTTAAKNLSDSPNGSVIVKEKTRAMSYSVYGGTGSIQGKEGIGGMIKRDDGFDPKSGNWEYFYSDQGGNLTAGKMKNCINCHSKASKKDYVFQTWKEE